MGWLRSCYSTQARFFYDSDIQLPIIWYWAAADAPIFTGRHTFAPITFSERFTYENPGVGESPSASRPWYNGSLPMAAPSYAVDGSPSWFIQGQMTSDPGLERTDFGIPVNCAGPEPGVYCAQSVGIESNFVLQDLLGNQVGTADYLAVSQLWPIADNDGHFAGSMMCYNYGDSEEPIWALTVVTNLWTGTSGQFKPYPLNSVGPAMFFQSITTVIGPPVGRLVQVP